MSKALHRSALIGLLLSLGVPLHAQDASVAAGADWLLTQQLVTGGFPWTVGGAAHDNSQGAIARSLLTSNAAVPSVAYLDATVRTGNLLVNNYPRRFSDGDPHIRPFDTLFLEELSLATGDPTYANFLQTNLWNKLKNGTYGESNNQNAAAWAASLPGFTEYPWVAMDPLFRAAPAIAAHYTGETQIRDAIMANMVVELNQTTTSTKQGDLTGLAAAIWASAHTGVNLDPTAGRWASRNSTQDLVNALVGYQRAAGDWPYDTSTNASTFVGDVAVTATSVIALSSWNKITYANNISRGQQFIRSLQQASGQILTNPGYPPNTETGVLVHAEGLIALGPSDGVLLEATNQPPTAVNDSASTPRNVPAVVNVLANDSDPDGTLNANSVVVTVAPAHGSTTVNASNGNVTFTPDTGYVGPDSFRYTVKDNAGATSNEATVNLTVNAAANQPPVAADDAATTNRGVAVVVNVLANDSDPDGTLNATSVVVTLAPANGTAAVNPSNGNVTFTPAAGYVGPDSFRYTVRDNAGATSNEATVSLTVTTPPNQPPVAVNDAASTDRGVPVALNVLANDSDPDGSLDPATVVVTSAPAHGTTAVNTSNGTITYTPAATWVGADSFRYTVKDDQGATSNQATVNLTVTGAPTTFTFTPVADAYVSQASPATNFGSASTLQVRQTATQSSVSYLRFVVSGLGGPVQSARLRLYVQSGGNETVTLYQASNNYLGTATPWAEGGINWNNADRSGATLGTNTMATGTWREFVVTPTVVGPGTYAFALINAPTRLSSFQSRENTNAPQLVIDTVP